MTETVEKTELEEILRQGMDALIQRLGYSGATRFIMAIERGEGDSVKELRELWKGKTASEVHKIVERGRRGGKITPPAKAKIV